MILKQCEFEGEFGRQVNSDSIWNVAREVTTAPTRAPIMGPLTTGVTASPTNSPRNMTLSHVPEIKNYIEFTRPCPEISFGGNLKRFETFTTNGQTLDVVIRNPLKYRGIAIEREQRLEKIVLEYRKVSGRSPHWNRAKDNTTNEELNLKNYKEDSFGYISATWKLPTLDFVYEIRLKSICIDEPGAPPHLNRYITDSLVGIIDRTSPSVFGVPQP